MERLGVVQTLVWKWCISCCNIDLLSQELQYNHHNTSAVILKSLSFPAPATTLHIPYDQSVSFDKLHKASINL